jgi:hypothetical protein
MELRHLTPTTASCSYFWSELIDHVPGGHDDIANAVSGVVGAISGVGVFNFEFWHDDRAWNGGAPSSDDVLWLLRR